MPEQPADPIHYEMKIPPEPPHPDDHAEKLEDKAPQAGNTGEANVARDDDKPHPERKPGG